MQYKRLLPLLLLCSVSVPDLVAAYKPIPIPNCELTDVEVKQAKDLTARKLPEFGPVEAECECTNYKCEERIASLKLKSKYTKEQDFGAITLVTQTTFPVDKTSGEGPTYAELMQAFRKDDFVKFLRSGDPGARPNCVATMSKHLSSVSCYLKPNEVVFSLSTEGMLLTFFRGDNEDLKRSYLTGLTRDFFARQEVAAFFQTYPNAEVVFAAEVKAIEPPRPPKPSGGCQSEPPKPKPELKPNFWFRAEDGHAYLQLQSKGRRKIKGRVPAAVASAMERYDLRCSSVISEANETLDWVGFSDRHCMVLDAPKPPPPILFSEEELKCDAPRECMKRAAEDYKLGVNACEQPPGAAADFETFFRLYRAESFILEAGLDEVPAVGFERLSECKARARKRLDERLEGYKQTHRELKAERDYKGVSKLVEKVKRDFPHNGAAEREWADEVGYKNRSGRMRERMKVKY